MQCSMTADGLRCLTGLVLKSVWELLCMITCYELHLYAESGFALYQIMSLPEFDGNLDTVLWDASDSSGEFCAHYSTWHAGAG